MRLFTALIPPPIVLDHVENALDQVIPLRAGHRNPRLPRTTWHITLAFYGEVPDGHVPEVIAEVGDRAREHRPFTVELSGAGTFSGHMGWIGVGGEVSRLKALMAAAADVWGGPGPETPGQTRQPHLTISRKVTEARLGDALRALAVYRGPAWTVTHFHVVESQLGQGLGGHPLYRSVAVVPLASASTVSTIDISVGGPL
jgi:2'-5' RNA ligase